LAVHNIISTSAFFASNLLPEMKKDEEQKEFDDTVTDEC